MLQMAAGPGGTGPLAQTIGYSVGGKSGTAHKQEGKGYASNKYRSWFVGMAPISNPRIIVAVMVDEPSNGVYYGGAVAAPVFSQVVQQTLRTDERAARHRGQAQIVAKGRAGRAGELLRRLPTPARTCPMPPPPRVAGRARRRPRCAPTAAACSPATPSSPGPAMRTTAARFVAAALAAGAAACLVEAEGVASLRLRRRAHRRAARPEGRRPARSRRLSSASPASALEVVATTGTNGKTSTAWWTGAGAERRWAGAARVIGTLGIGEPRASHGRAVHRPDHARPGALQAALRDFVDAGLCGLRDRGLVDRPAGAPPGRHAHRRWRCSPTSRRTTSTTTAAWPPTGTPSARCSTGRGCGRGGQHRRRARRRAGRHAAGRGRSTCGPARTQRPGAAAAPRGLHHATAAWPSTLREGDAACCRCAAR